VKTVVTAIPDLEHELPADTADAPEWLKDALQVPREEGWVASGGANIHYFRWVIQRIQGYY